MQQPLQRPPIQTAPPARQPGRPMLSSAKLTLACFRAPPTIPTEVTRNKSELARRSLLLQAQDALHETSVWTRELFTPADADAAASSGAIAAQTRLAEAKERAEKSLAAHAKQHDETTSKLKEAATRHSDEIARLKRAPPDDEDASKRPKQAQQLVTAVPSDEMHTSAREPGSASLALL